MLAATGFLLTGISHVIGRQTLFLLSDANPELQESAYMTATVVRIWVNGLAQIGLGWFAVQLSWLGLEDRHAAPRVRAVRLPVGGRRAADGRGLHPGLPVHGAGVGAVAGGGVGSRLKALLRGRA